MVVWAMAVCCEQLPCEPRAAYPAARHSAAPPCCSMAARSSGLPRRHPTHTPAGPWASGCASPTGWTCSGQRVGAGRSHLLCSLLAKVSVHARVGACCSAVHTGEPLLTRDLPHSAQPLQGRGRPPPDIALKDSTALEGQAHPTHRQALEHAAVRCGVAHKLQRGRVRGAVRVHQQVVAADVGGQDVEQLEAQARAVDLRSVRRGCVRSLCRGRGRAVVTCGWSCRGAAQGGAASGGRAWSPEDPMPPPITVICPGGHLSHCCQ